MQGTLAIVPTPIGNLEDITFRAINALKESDYIICEDTRQTIKLLNHYGIKKALISFYTQNQFRRIPELIKDLKSGKKLALVSDSGTPGISDPGYFLISKVLEEKINIVSLPGPTAFVTALVASGLPTNGFVFLGFLKRKAGKLKKELQKAAELEKTIIFYESPHRIAKTISLCGEIFNKDRKIAIGRELTKNYEEYIRGTLGEISEQLKGRELKGELVVIISPTGNAAERVEEMNGEWQ